ncbi:hypothetical protein GCM10010172_47490 [Paractinoplanes ferrugineus]|uniref:Secreted protein n=1 Tax=Paractinoplanes ferrugineus TaxID=113564 RepID=A0A919IZU7_9ACTN|nr:hypothetical protein [Actinoplanes ferrugineus]GIE10333.1 hypothetical protein Afe05nite_21730 [Actinoplanes ferrugineus]
MIRKAVAWIAAVTAALLVGLPGLAQATVVWTPASCAVGSFGPVTVDVRGHYLLPVHMTLCEPYQPRFNYGIALFRPGGYVPLVTGDKLVSYATSAVLADVLPKTPVPVFGLCLMRDVDTRTACVRVDTSAEGVATSTPIPADDALVADPVLFLTHPPVIVPNYCATCVTVNL